MAHSFRFSPTKLCNLIKILFRFGSVLEGSFVALMRLGHLWLSEVMMRWSSNTLGSVISYYLKRANGGEREGGGKGEGEGEGEGGGNGVAKTLIFGCVTVKSTCYTHKALRYSCDPQPSLAINLINLFRQSIVTPLYSVGDDWSHFAPLENHVILKILPPPLPPEDEVSYSKSTISLAQFCSSHIQGHA